MKKLIGYALLSVWPVFVISMVVLESAQCGWNRTIWQDAACKSPDKPRPRMNVAYDYQKSGQFSHALDHYQHAIRLSYNPRLNSREQDMTRLLAATNISQILLHSNNLESARKILESTWNAYPGFPGIATNLSAILVSDGQYQLAVDILERAILSVPEYSWYPSMNIAALHYNLGESYSQLNNCPSANAAFKRAIILDPGLTIPTCNSTETENTSNGI